MANVCPICGNPTALVYGKYPRKDSLCKECAKKLLNNEIEQCPDCGKWKETNKQCICKKKTSKSENELTCIICGEPSSGKHFCITCWNKYKNKSIDLRITNCSTTQILDEYGNRTKKTKDGRLVRSLSEKIILDYFFDNYIRVVYEKSIPYINEKGEEKELHPDFYLVDYDLFIEFNGLTTKAYLKTKKYVNEIYAQKGLKVEILESKDLDDIETTMDRILDKYPKK